MALEFNRESFTTPKQILLFPDHYVNVARTFLKDDPAAVEVEGRKIIKAGTVYPSNDADAEGIVWADYDVTRGDVTGALILHGFVKSTALPEAPTAEAQAALSMIKFLPKI